MEGSASNGIALIAMLSACLLALSVSVLAATCSEVFSGPLGRPAALGPACLA